MTNILAVANQKGGVGKTDLSVNLSCYLASLGNRVLLIDLDPQANATDYLTTDTPILSTADLLIDENVSISQSLIRSRVENLDIIPSHSNLSAAQLQLSSDVDMQFKLKKKIKNVSEYPYVVIDTPPSLGLLTINAFTAAHEVVIPIQTHYFALDGVTNLMDTIKKVRTSLNPKLKMRGIVLTMYDKRTLLSRQVKQKVMTEFNGKVFNTIIPMNIRLAESPSYHKPILQYAPKSPGAKAYMKLAQEFTS